MKAIRLTKREFCQEYLLPVLTMFAMLGGLLLLHGRTVRLGGLLQSPAYTNDTLTSPTVGRLVTVFVSTAAFLLLSAAARGMALCGKMLPAFWLGFPAGILLWQITGEDFWHFSLNGTPYLVPENIVSLPCFLLLILLLYYGQRTHCFDFGIWCVLLSFSVNWIGHYLLLGSYEFVNGYMEKSVWFLWASLVLTVLLLGYSLWYLLRKARSTADRIPAAMLAYLAVSLLVFGIAEG